LKTLTVQLPFKKIQLHLQIHPTPSALRQWVRRNDIFDSDHPTPLSGVYGVCVKYENAHVRVVLSEECKPWSPSVVHEFVHAADYVSPHLPRGVDRAEFRAYFVNGLMELHRWWYDRGFPGSENPEALAVILDAAMPYLCQSMGDFGE